MMGHVQPREWYERTYGKQEGNRQSLPTFKPPWPRYSNWHMRLPEMTKRIGRHDHVLDLGCGPGILAAALWHVGHQAEYTGIDFSEVQLGRARMGNKREGHQKAVFIYGDVTTFSSDTLKHFKEMYGMDVVVLAEILEHLEDDLGLLERIPLGVRVLLTVPTRDDPSHIRVFSADGQDARDRYGSLMSMDYHIRILNKAKHPARVLYHVIDGVRK